MKISTLGFVAGLDIGYGNIKGVGGSFDGSDVCEFILPSGATPISAMPERGLESNLMYEHQSCSTIFKNNYVKAGIKRSKPEINSMSSFKSVFEITSNELDIRGIRAARTMYMDMGYAIEKAIFKAWEQDMKEANSGE
jgi:hypothetical protein